MQPMTIHNWQHRYHTRWHSCMIYNMGYCSIGIHCWIVYRILDMMHICLVVCIGNSYLYHTARMCHCTGYYLLHIHTAHTH